MDDGMQRNVVELAELEPGIVRLTMRDREHRNTFSTALTQGLISAFQRCGEDARCKVVILTGYDTYFASGGTREALLAIHEGKAKFTDASIYSLPLDCPVPVISAMQGHGIGGGFVLGMFADFVILSRESIYTTNFMKYGFTPGMGATAVLPRKFGLPLAEEFLLAAANYRGAELERRGVPFPVVPRDEVAPRALELARQLADKPRVSLVTLKRHLTAELRASLPAVVEQEVAMHDATFHRPEVRTRIDELFGQ